MYDLTLYLFIIWQASAATELRRRTQREETGVNEYTESEAGEDLRDTSYESQRLPRPAHDGLDVSVENETEALDSHAMSRHLLAGTPASTPAPITTGSIGQWTSGGTCYEHKHCKQNYITDPFSGLRTWGGGPGQFCHKDKSCNTCGDCQNDATDAIDGQCPQDLCPGSGALPTCLNASLLLDSWACPHVYTFQVRKHFPNSKDAPEVAYPPRVKARYMTPFNRLVGGVLLTHTRAVLTSCAASTNAVVQSFIDNTSQVSMHTCV